MKKFHVRLKLKRPTRQEVIKIYLPVLLMFLLLIMVISVVTWLLMNASGTRVALEAEVHQNQVQIDYKNPMSAEDFAAYKAAALASEPVAPPPVHAGGVIEFSDITKTPPANAFDQLTLPANRSDMLEITPFGPLPKISEKGDMAWQVYAGKVDNPDKLPMVAIVLDDVGLNDATTANLIQDMPAAVNLAFTPYAQDLDVWLARARAKGHEVLMGVPMEPRTYPQNDPGPKALMKDYSDQQNMDALKWAMGRGTGYVGMVTMQGDAFTETAWRIDPVMQAINRRGLLFVDATTSKGQQVTALRAQALQLPYAAAIRLDDSLAQPHIRSSLESLNRIAKKEGAAVGIANSYPVVLTLLQEWLPTLARQEILLVPISAIGQKALDDD